MQIIHAKSLTMGDTTDTNLVRPSDWNSKHNLSFALGGNTTVGSSTTGTAVPFAATGNMSIGISNGSLMFSAPEPSDRLLKELIQGERLTSIVALTQASIRSRPMFNPFYMDAGGLVAKTVRFIASVAGSSNRSLVGSFHCGIYSIGTNDTHMTLVASDSFSLSQTVSSLHNGGLFLDFTGMSTVTLSKEGRYAMAFMCIPGSAQTNSMPMTLWGGDNMPVISRIMNAGGSVALNATDQIVPFFGRYSTSTSAMPASVALSHIEGASSAVAFEYYAAIREV